MCPSRQLSFCVYHSVAPFTGTPHRISVGCRHCLFSYIQPNLETFWPLYTTTKPSVWSFCTNKPIGAIARALKICARIHPAYHYHYHHNNSKRRREAAAVSNRHFSRSDRIELLVHNLVGSPLPKHPGGPTCHSNGRLPSQPLSLSFLQTAVIRVFHMLSKVFQVGGRSALRTTPRRTPSVHPLPDSNLAYLFIKSTAV